MTPSNNLRQRTLIISSWAPPMVGGPQSLYNLVSSIDPSGYRVLTSRRVLQAGMGDGKIGSWLPGDYFAIEGRQIEKQSFQAQATTSPKRPNPIANAMLMFPVFGRFVYNTVHLCVDLTRYVRTGISVVRQERIEHLLGISDIGLALISTWLIAKRTRRPYSLYLYDLYLGNLLQAPFSWLARLLERRIMTSAKLVLVTNEVTGEYYKKRYGQKINIAVVHNSIFDRHTVNDYRPQPPYTIIFTGNVYWAQEQAVMNLVKAMAQLTDLPLTLKLYVPNPSPSFKTAVSNTPNIELTAASQDQMPAIQSQATLLFLPLAWDTKAPDIIATATPGKFTDYLSAGRPMLVHAPEYAYVSRYAKQHHLGVVVDQNDVQGLVRAIRDFIAQTEQGQRYVENALRIFYENHEAERNGKKLTELLNMV